MRMKGWSLIASVLMFAACGSSDGSAMTSGGQTGCTPGATLTCACASGGQGTAFCMTGGQVGVCSCAGAQVAGSGVTPPRVNPVVTTPVVNGTAGAATTTLPTLSSPAADGGVLPPTTLGAAGMVATTGAATTPPATAAAGSPASGAAGKSATAAGQCPAGEMCQTSSIGGFKFCSQMTQALPDACPTGNQPCGSDNKGTCFDAMPVLGLPGLYCLYLSCMP
jgi:hypothetical protein